MNVKTKRSKVVFARLLESEYHQLAAICDAGDSATVSDLVREAIRDFIRSRTATISEQQCGRCGHIIRRFDELKAMLSNMGVPADVTEPSSPMRAEKN